MDITIKIKDINQLGLGDAAAIMTRLSWPDSGSDSSIQKELSKRYLHVNHEQPHPEMAMALIWVDDVLTGWVGSRPWPEKFKGDPITAQTIECFVDEAYRRRGLGRLGLQALICAGFIDRNKPVSVYASEVIKMAEQCGCKIVLLCDP